MLVAWIWVSGLLVTTVLVCRMAWLRLDAEEREEAPVVMRVLTFAAGVTAGAVWPVWWLVLGARRALWPDPAPQWDALERNDEHAEP